MNKIERILLGLEDGQVENSGVLIFDTPDDFLKALKEVEKCSQMKK